MTIATTIEKYLTSHHVAYDIISHPRTPTSLKTAQAAEIEADCVAKAVLLEDDAGYMMAVLPASHHLQMNELQREVGRTLHMADENEIGQVFRDCDNGAIPALGTAYGVDTIWEECLTEHPDIYFEAGDHERLVHVKTADFMELLQDARHGHFSAAR